MWLKGERVGGDEGEEVMYWSRQCEVGGLQ